MEGLSSVGKVNGKGGVIWLPGSEPPAGWQGGAGGTFIPCKGLGLCVPLAAGDCQDISGAAGSGTRVSVYESLCSGGCVK